MPMYEETRTVVGQPWRLAAVLMSSCALFLVILAVASPAWVTNDSRRNSQSIWEVCWGSDALEKCVNTLGSDWRVTIVILEFLTGLLCVIAIILAVLAVCKVLSIRSFVPGICILLAALLQLIAVIVYPVKFLAEPVRLPPPVYYEFDWGYGVAFGAFFFMVAAGIMFFLKSYSNKQSY